MTLTFSRPCFLLTALLFAISFLGLHAIPARAQLTTVTLFRFSGTNGIGPDGTLIQGSDGNFYGTTARGGSSDGSGSDGLGYGTVFKITSSGTLTTLVNFTNSNGEYPVSALVQGSDGNFYGTTTRGGASGWGTVFQMTPTGTLTTLHAFSMLDGNSENGDGAGPVASLIQGSNGSFYGTTPFGGMNGEGTVFKITPAGTLTTLYAFSPVGTRDDNSDGADSVAALVLGSDGNFYGTTQIGGTSGSGSVFTMTPSGALTSIYSFGSSTATGSEPVDALVEGPDGNFYGTTIQGGGASNEGTVFKITPSGIVTPLYSFGSAGFDGASPKDSLTLGSDGNFYGTAQAGGSSEDGTVFEITPTGTESILVNLTRTTGDQPLSGLVQGRDGNFYGTAQFGGYNNNGTVFGLFGPPTAEGESETTIENSPVTFAVAFNDPSGKGVTGISFPTPPSHGMLNVGAITESGTTGTVEVTYTPAAGFIGTDRFTYTVTGYTGTSAPQTVTVNVQPPVPVISSFAPASGPVGTGVVLTGMGFTGATSVKFNGTSASFSVTSDTQITTTVPAGATTGPITVGNVSGTATGATFTVTTPVPSITGFTPGSGPVGTIVTIAGTNFIGATSVDFYGKAAAFTVKSSTQITATVPSGATTGAISVGNSSGLAFSAASFTVTSPPPTVTGFTPMSGSVGTTVTVTGTNLTGTTVVGFQGKHATSFTVNTQGTQITTTVPSGAVTGSIAVLTPGGQAKSAASFTVTVAVQPPTITGFSPSSGSVGTTVTITGTNLTGTTVVGFQGKHAASFTVNATGTQITTTVPAGAVTGPVAIATPGGTAHSSTSFTVTS